jgi:hypothetical protein
VLSPYDSFSFRVLIITHADQGLLQESHNSRDHTCFSQRALAHVSID